MKQKVLSLVFLILSFQGYCQNDDFESSGKAFATIFANLHNGITGAAVDKAAFELVRGYIGYERNLSSNFYAKINVDIGSPEDLSPYSKLRRYAYFKNAYLRYSQNKFQVEFGLISLKQFKVQEKIWERRYLMKTLADQYKLGSSADLGVNFHYKFNNWVDADFTIMNGEGYNNIQSDGILKYGVGSTLKIPKNFTSRVFYDFTKNEVVQSTILLFTSYDHKNKWNIASEFIYRTNNRWRENQNIFGMSFYGKYNINSEFQLFARFDKIESNILKDEINPWRLLGDGSALVAGLQYKPIKDIKLALNYHDWYPLAANRENRGFIYLNIEVKM